MRYALLTGFYAPCQPIRKHVAQARRLLNGAHCRPMSHSTPQVNPRISSAGSAAGVVARFLKARGVDRIFALCGGHIMPLWMRADAEGIRIVDVRDERAAVHMAQAHAELTGGLGVALVTDDRPSVVAAARGTAMAEADVVVTVGQRLDFQLAFGSPAVFGSARFVRIADTGSELRDNRRGTVEVFATPSATLAAIVDAAGDRP